MLGIGETFHIVPGFFPQDLDDTAGDVDTDVVSLANYTNATFILEFGAVATPTGNIEVYGATSAAKANATKILALQYRTMTTTDTWSDVEEVIDGNLAWGTEVSQANDHLLAIELSVGDLTAATDTYDLSHLFVRIPQDDGESVIASCTVILFSARYPGVNPVSAIG